MEKEEMNIMKGHILAMFTGEAPFEPTVPFPQSHIIYAGSIHQANKIIKEGGYHLLLWNCLCIIELIAAKG